MPAQPHTPAALSDNPTLAANVQALRERFPNLADQFAAIRDFGPARIVTGRDGSPVVLLDSDGQTDRWLGGSSMPTVSTPAMLADFNETSASILLPTIGTGHEPAMLARRLARFAAVIVHERDPRTLALALCVVDLTQPLRDGRIVPLCGTLEESLAAFFDSNPGYEFPTRLHHHPTLSARQMEEATSAVRRAALRVHQARNLAAVQLRDEILNRSTPQSEPPTEVGGRSSTIRPPQRPFPHTGQANRWLVVSIDPSRTVLEQSSAIQQAAEELDIDCATCVPDLPRFCSPLARLAAIRDHAPDFVIFLNCTPQAANVVLPQGCPHACWFLDQAATSPIMLTGLADAASHAMIFAASQSVRDRLLHHGVPKERIELLEAGINPDAIPCGNSPIRTPHVSGGPLLDDSTNAVPAQISAPVLAPSPDHVFPRSPDLAEGRVVIFADGCDLSPAAAQIGLESHQRLWQCLVQIVTKRADEFAPELMDAWLADAEKRTDVHLADPRMRAELLAIATARLPATIIALRIIESLRRATNLPPAHSSRPGRPGHDSTVHIDLWGDGWQTHEPLLPIWRGPVPEPSQRAEIYKDAPVVIIPWLDARAATIAREVLAAGRQVILSHKPTDPIREYPQTGGMLAELPAETSAANLVQQVSAWIATAANRPGPAARSILVEHGVAARLQALASARILADATMS